MTENTEINWSDYEAITKYIYESLGTQHGIKVVGYGRENNIEGQSGVKHQIDVLTEQLQGDQRLLTAIECKYWNEKVNKDVVMKLWGLMLDADIACGIIVCKSGFTRDTKLFAEHKGIKLVILRETDENDEEHGREVELGTLDLQFLIHRSRVNIMCIDFGSRTVHFDPSVGAVYCWNLHDAAGNVYPLKPLLLEFVDKVRSQDEPLKNTTIDYSVIDNLFVKIAGEDIPVNKLSVTGFLSHDNLTTGRSLTLTDRVWMIMEQLFDKTRITLSKSGLIWNLPKNEN